MTCLINPNTGSTVHLRNAYSLRPRRVCKRWRMAANGVGLPGSGAGSAKRSNGEP